MAPSAPPLTREKSVSWRDGAKGLMHRIPSEHKARLIELGYIEEVFGGIRLTAAGRMRIAEGGPTEIQNPPRTLLSMQALRWRALAEIRLQPGCSGVLDIAINHVTDQRAENN